jgi:hypothetical protein
MIKMDMEGGFKESALRLNAYLVKLTEWNEQHIKERAKQLAGKAEQIWKYPRLVLVSLLLIRLKKSQPRNTQLILMISMLYKDAV